MPSLSLGSRPGSGAVLKALDKALAIIEFDPQGNIITANANFCEAMGYSLSEIAGKHHSLFVEPDYAASVEYRNFWVKLGRGEFDAREFKRIGKGGREVWIQASYNPIKGLGGKVLKVVKVATDITREKLRNAEFECNVRAISRVQAVISFMPSGEIITANENFLNVMGYKLEEIQGKHHRIFVPPEDASSPDYVDFWRKLNAGEFVEAEFKRIGKGGKEVWIRASYNPIFDQNRKVAKIVKFATDASDIVKRDRAVREIAQGLAALANHDLRHRLDRPFGAAFEDLRADFNTAAGRLQQAMSSIAATTSGLRAGSDEIASASDDLSRRTEQQAASLEQTAAALDQITATVRRSAESAKQAADAASAAKAVAVRSGEVMGEAVAAMGGIEQSSAQITQIIGVIDEIAFQTNLLALNAGVEAARAGDAGRGFAVVAQEVRALAQRSAEASKDIRTLIASSSQQVQRGVRLVGETGQALEGIVGKVAEIDALIVQMARSSQDQAVSLSEVNSAVNQMDQVTQQNAAMVEEATAAASSLKSEAATLADLVAQFEVGDARPPVGAAGPAPPVRRAPPGGPVAKAQARIAASFRSGGAPLVAADWEEF